MKKLSELLWYWNNDRYPHFGFRAFFRLYCRDTSLNRFTKWLHNRRLLKWSTISSFLPVVITWNIRLYSRSLVPPGHQRARLFLRDGREMIERLDRMREYANLRELESLATNVSGHATKITSWIYEHYSSFTYLLLDCFAFFVAICWKINNLCFIPKRTEYGTISGVDAP